MKKLGQFVVFLAILAVAIPVIQYRTLRPCGMLERELVKRAQAQAESVKQQGVEKAGEFGEEIGRLAEEIGSAVEEAYAGVAEGLAEAKVAEMSTRKCVTELVRIKLGRDS